MTPRTDCTAVPAEVQRASWAALWDELLSLTEEDALPVEEARQAETGEEPAPLHRGADDDA